jgi:hypothetical protein
VKRWKKKEKYKSVWGHNAGKQFDPILLNHLRNFFFCRWWFTIGRCFLKNRKNRKLNMRMQIAAIAKERRKKKGIDNSKCLVFLPI